MSVLEYSGKFAHMGSFSNKVHNCKICPFFSTSVFLMVSHVRTHRLPSTLFNCEKATVEIYYCKDCNFRTDLTIHMKNHIEKRHSSHTQNEGDSSAGENSVQNYICKKCNFQTYFVLKWYQHYKACPAFNVMKIDVQKRVTTELQSKFIKRESLNIHKTTKHIKTRWQHCCKSPHEVYLKTHMNRKHYDRNNLKWHKCKKCPFKTTVKNCLQQHQNEKQVITSKYDCKEESQSESIEMKQLDTALKTTSKKYICDQCEFNSKYRISLNAHKFKKHSIYDVHWYHYNNCPYKTHIKYYLQEHDLKYSKINWRKCNHCLFQTISNSVLQRHVNWKHLSSGMMQKSCVKWFQCKLCPFKTIKKDHLQQHEISEHPSKKQIKWHQCGKCSHRVSTMGTLIKHIDTYHSENNDKQNNPLGIIKDKKLYGCSKPPCGAKVNNDLNKHHHHTDNSKIPDTVWYECGLCKFKTTSNEVLNEHTLDQHPTSKKELNKCDFCSYKTKRNHDLQRHILCKHQSVTEIDFLECDQGSYKSKSHPQLGQYGCKPNELTKDIVECRSYKPESVEEKIHIQSYQCGLCEFKGNTWEALNQHVINSHQTKTEESYECDKCSYRGKFNRELNQHKLEHHSDSGASKNSEKNDGVWYYCRECKFVTQSMESLKEHSCKSLCVNPKLKCGACNFQTEFVKVLTSHIIGEHGIKK